jgi:hypothetical protein
MSPVTKWYKLDKLDTAQVSSIMTSLEFEPG